MSAARDAIVIGGGFNGLIAAAALARAGQGVVLLEARAAPGGLCETAVMDGTAVPVAAHTLSALAPEIAASLDLKFAARDLPLVGLRADGRHLLLGREVHAAAQAIAPHSRADAEAFPRFRRELFALARDLRALWWTADADKEKGDAAVARSEALDALAYSGAAAWLGGWFESDAVKAMLAFDATADGAAAAAPPSALALVWRAAQEMSGLQGAVAIPENGVGSVIGAALGAALAAGVELRSNAAVAALRVEGGQVKGVVLASGETIAAPLVLSSLSRGRTRALAPKGAFGLAEANANGSAETACAKVVVALERGADFGNALPPIARWIVADRMESHVQAHEAARAGRLPDELVCEAVPLLGAGRNLLSVLVRPVPVAPAEGWDALCDKLAEKVVAALAVFDPALKETVTATRVWTPADLAQAYGFEAAQATVARLLAPARRRIETPVDGLFLCGSDAEPIGAISGRAPALAAKLGHAHKTFAEGASQ
jgi:phytoene dehydrogenase-like protein